MSKRLAQTFNLNFIWIPSNHSYFINLQLTLGTMFFIQWSDNQLKEFADKAFNKTELDPEDVQTVTLFGKLVEGLYILYLNIVFQDDIVTVTLNSLY